MQVTACLPETNAFHVRKGKDVEHVQDVACMFLAQQSGLGFFSPPFPILWPQHLGYSWLTTGTTWCVQVHHWAVQY